MKAFERIKTMTINEKALELHAHLVKGRRPSCRPIMVWRLLPVFHRALQNHVR